MFWAYGSYVGGRALVLVSTALLARLLSPRDFGLVALALIFTALLETVSDLGISRALVITPEREVLDRADTAFAASVALGVVLTLVVAALGPAAAAFFHQPRLEEIMPLLGLNFLLRSLGTTHYALAEKRLDFRARTIAEFADVLLRGSAGVALAAAGLGAMSIVLGYLIGTAALTFTLWLVVPWRPRRRVRRAHLREMLRFGATLSAVDIVATLSNNVDYVFVGRVLGPASLGLYTLGFRLPELLIMNLSLVAGHVLFPAFATVRREDLGRAFGVALRYTLMLSFPLTATLAVLAQPFILALFGSKWAGSVVAMQVLTLYALGLTLNIPAGAAYKASGRVGVLLFLALPRLGLLVISIAVFIDSGIVAVAACQAGAAAVVAIISTAMAARLLDVGLRPILAAIWPPLVAAAAMAGAMVPFVAWLSAWPALVVGGLVGAVVYLAALRLLAPDALADITARLRAGRGKGVGEGPRDHLGPGAGDAVV